ncbi:alkaline ceramidase 3 [Aplysia californica]|uniref:Alkaline ceramidase n=1 Tax=Aplysia californica TaxID=6500 RepID=A0ABM0JLD1_APLCA|nr:alkaline ceramidase 3 [Aplysia californica]
MAPVEGYWGKQTATIDWCEENYVVSYYIAEFWNTVSNAVMIFAPLAMVFVGLKENHEKRFLYSFSAITVVGMGSWLFHMTLQYSMQLMDELPMIWGSSFLVYSLYMIKSKPDEECIPLQVFLVVYCVLVTLVYVLINAPVFHEVSYALMVISMVLIALRIVQTMHCNVMLFAVSLFTYALGFLLWNVDNLCCHHLRYIRDQMDKSSGMLFECHAWWHIFAGFGTYMALLFA